MLDESDSEEELPPFGKNALRRMVAFTMRSIVVSVMFM